MLHGLEPLRIRSAEEVFPPMAPAYRVHLAGLLTDLIAVQGAGQGTADGPGAAG